MALVFLTSLHGSPGTTTIAVALAASLDGGLVAEADVDGGVLAVRFGLAREPGVVTLAADRSAAVTDRLGEHVQQAPGGLPVLVGPESAQHAMWLWSRAGDHLAAALRQYDGVAIVDAGRLREDPRTSLRTGGTLSAIVLRPRADELAIAAARLSSLDESERPPLILVGDRPYPAAEVASELGCEVLGVIADDERAVDALWLGGSPRQLLRSTFARSIRSLADTVASRISGSNDRNNAGRETVSTS